MNGAYSYANCTIGVGWFCFCMSFVVCVWQLPDLRHVMSVVDTIPPNLNNKSAHQFRRLRRRLKVLTSMYKQVSPSTTTKNAKLLQTGCQIFKGTRSDCRFSISPPTASGLLVGQQIWNQIVEFARFGENRINRFDDVAINQSPRLHYGTRNGGSSLRYPGRIRSPADNGSATRSLFSPEKAAAEIFPWPAMPGSTGLPLCRIE